MYQHAHGVKYLKICFKAKMISMFIEVLTCFANINRKIKKKIIIFIHEHASAIIISHFSLKLHMKFWKYFHSVDSNYFIKIIWKLFDSKYVYVPV